MEMDVRSYDPAIARWTSMDPVIHYSKSTYNAFDNNPVYWADPSGADSKSDILDLFNKSASGTTYYNDGNNGWTTTKPEDNVIGEKDEMVDLANSWNEIFLRKFGETPFSVVREKRTRSVKVKDNLFGDDEYKEEEYDVYVIKGSMAFDWDQHKYTRMLRDILESKQDVVVDIMDGTRGNWLMKNRAGGEIQGPNRIELSNKLIQNCSSNTKRIYWTIGGVALHELLWHLHPDGGSQYTGILGKGETHVRMREYFLTKTKYKNSAAHRPGDRQNKKINSTKGE